MRFLDEEYQSIKSTIEELDLDFESFSFVKKKGHLHVVDNNNNSFSYFRRSETRLSESGEWVEITFYMVNGNKDKLIDSWDKVLELIKKWLTS